METDSLASENHFLPFSQIASQLLLVEAIHPSTELYFSTNPSFRLVETCFLFSGNIIIFISSFFFLPMETINEIRGKYIFKDGPYSC